MIKTAKELELKVKGARLLTKAELEKYMQKYGCTSPEQLDEVLWFEYGITLINKVK
jgi:hypothetical protein